MNKVSFFTQCYEQDWHAIIDSGGFTRKIENLNYKFVKKTLIITNVDDRLLVESKLKKLIDEKIIDEYYFTDDYSDEILKFFDISIDSFNGGYWYSIAPLLSVYLCDSDYLVYLTGDSLTEKNDYNWIDEGIKIMENDFRVKAVNPVWNLKYDEAKNEEKNYILRGFKLENNDPNWCYGMGFSDQCFLIPTKLFKTKIYNEKNQQSDFDFPKYAGDSFEKRISSFLKNNNFYRITSNNSTYYHPRWY